MDSNKIQSGMCVSPRIAATPKRLKDADSSVIQTEPQQPDSVSFQGKGSNIIGRSNLVYKRLCDFMKEPGEFASALIAFVGTALVAPFAILVSPSRKNDGLTKEQQKEKKQFQAYRQPVSALLAFGFQVPTTFGLKILFDYYAYDKKSKFFADKDFVDKKGKKNIGVGSLVPDKKYLKRKVKKDIQIVPDNGKLVIEGKYKDLMNGIDLKADLIEKMRKEYTDIGLEVDEQALEKRASSKRRLKKFAAEKIADKEYDKLFDTKVQEFLKRNDFEINELDLVIEKYQKAAKDRNRQAFKDLKKQHLNIFDRMISNIGFSTKHVKEFEDAEKKLAKELGLDILKDEFKQQGKNFETEMASKEAKVRYFLKNRVANSQKVYKMKRNFLTLGTNLVMVAISCVALNWLHPKFVKFLENMKHKNENNQPNEAKKVEVRA